MYFESFRVEPISLLVDVRDDGCMHGMDIHLVDDFCFVGFAFAFMGFSTVFFAVFLVVVPTVVVAGRETQVLGKKERVWFRVGRDDANRGRVSECAAVVVRRGEEMRIRVRWENIDIIIK